MSASLHPRLHPRPHPRRTHRLALALTGTLAAGALVTGTAAGPPTASAAPPSTTTAAAATAAAPATSVARAGTLKRVKTRFALQTAGYGSRVVGSMVPAASDRTALESIGCTTVAGKAKRNYEADTAVPGLGDLYGVETNVWTEAVGQRVSSWSTHEIAKLVLFDRLEIHGLTSMAHAYWDGSRYRTETSTSIAKILVRNGGQVSELDIPSPNRDLEIPGLVKISLGKTVEKAGSGTARAAASALDVTVYPTETHAVLAQSLARVTGGVKSGVFRGYSTGARAQALADNVQVGRTQLSKMPCQGTRGKTMSSDVARADLRDLGGVRAVATSQMGDNRVAYAEGFERAKAAKVSLLDGRIEVDLVRAVANVRSEKSGARRVTSDSVGTKVVGLTIDGQSYDVEAGETYEIPGLVKIETGVERQLRQGLEVVGLRLTLLGGDAAIVDLAVAKLAIRKGVKTTP
ncbi:MAG: hypothetical protein CMH83_19710 [Nocardioides sp.]|nr:hypothetical protein [Nocardioides sp.]